jgi:pimeloyl-ACP methyl ester carboxylesterase
MVTIIEKNDQKESVALLADFIGEHYDNAPESTKTSSTRAQYIYSMATFINNPWARSFVAFQTANYLKKLEVPLLAIHGEADIQVPFESNSNGFEHYPQASLHKLPELNHLFQKCDSCTVMEYGDIEQTIDQQVLDILVNWINQL